MQIRFTLTRQTLHMSIFLCRRVLSPMYVCDRHRYTYCSVHINFFQGKTKAELVTYVATSYICCWQAITCPSHSKNSLSAILFLPMVCVMMRSTVSRQEGRQKYLKWLTENIFCFGDSKINKSLFTLANLRSASNLNRSDLLLR